MCSLVVYPRICIRRQRGVSRSFAGFVGRTGYDDHMQAWVGVEKLWHGSTEGFIETLSAQAATGQGNNAGVDRQAGF
jgi:hypothetical protein